MSYEQDNEQNGRSYTREGQTTFSERPAREGAPRRQRFNAAGRVTPRQRFQDAGGSYQQGSYRQGENSYANREGYQPRQGGWQSRANEEAEGYQTRQNGWQSRAPRTGGYQPRYNNYSQRPYQQGDGAEGYQPRPYQPRQNGYQPRAYQSGEGGEGYQPRQNGYQPRGYRQSGASGGYQQRGYGRDGYQQAPRGKYPSKQGFRPKPIGKRRIEYSEQPYDPTEPVRLNKILANAGVCSRRDADKYIEAGVVSVNGEVITELGHKVLRTDKIMFHGEPVQLEKKVYVLLNKPKGYVTTSEDPENRKTVMALVERACPERIYPVGRLDRNTTGVLLFTNDGEMASKLTHPQYKKKKIYHVFLDRAVTAADMQKIAEGITLDDGEIRADDIQYAHPTDKKQVGIEIHSGRNRIVRRIFEHLGYKVTKLDRVFFAGLTKKNLRRGDWRFLTEKEVQMLRMGAFE